MPTKANTNMTETYLRAHLQRRENEERERIARLVERKRLAEERIAELRKVLAEKDRVYLKASSALERAAEHSVVQRFNRAQDIAIAGGYGHSWRQYANWLTSGRADARGVRSVHEYEQTHWAREVIFSAAERETILRYRDLQQAERQGNVERINALRALEQAAAAVAEIEKELAQ